MGSHRSRSGPEMQPELLLDESLAWAAA